MFGILIKPETVKHWFHPYGYFLELWALLNYNNKNSSLYDIDKSLKRKYILKLEDLNSSIITLIKILPY